MQLKGEITSLMVPLGPRADGTEKEGTGQENMEVDGIDP